MGVLNITPDSFSDGGRFYGDISLALRHAESMVRDGADIIDIGGESTRPGANTISTDVELHRVLPVIRAIHREWGSAVQISIDSYKSTVVEAALTEGASLVNCLGGSKWNADIAGVVARSGCPVIVYHLRGEPATMMHGDLSTADIVADVSAFFHDAIELGRSCGMRREQFLLDPGIGFGKTVAQNLELLRRLGELQDFGLPVVIGVSRKAHLGTVLQRSLSLPAPPGPEERLEAALAETFIAVRNGARLVRTHDVAPTRRFVVMLDALLDKDRDDPALAGADPRG